jgi:ABC-type transporter Mla subunit MlaD
MTTSIADRFAAQIADLKRRSDESDRKLAESVARCHATLDRLSGLLAEMEEELA